MKKILTIILLTFAFSQSEEIKWKTYGVGFDFHMLPSQALMLSAGEAAGGLLGVYFPFISEGGYLLEPNITYANTYEERDYEDNEGWLEDNSTSSTIWSLTLGIFKTWRSENINRYAGVRVGKMWLETDRDPGAENDVESDALMWGPVLGAEWFINENFSFGGEAMFTKISSEEESDISDDYRYTDTNQINMIIPKFIVRYYF
tara:strand:- start:2715 stop:3323 length:609 start_codon:yes stop_codon:yes gene_type:complete